MKSEIETYLARLALELERRGLDGARIVEEARGHLTDAIEQSVQRGSAPEDAERAAIARFGAPEEVAVNFAAEQHRLLFVAAAIGRAARRMLAMILPHSSDTQEQLHVRDTQAGWHFALKSRRGLVNPELLAIASHPDTELVPFLERVAPAPLGPLGKIQSLILLDDRIDSSRRIKRYRAVFGDETKVICDVKLPSDGKGVSLDWSRRRES